MTSENNDTPNLRTISLLRDKVVDWKTYPFNIPIIQNLTDFSISNRICFFAGENGSGKSTLLEGIAEHCGFNKEGGSKNISYKSNAKVADTASYLADFLRLSWSKKILHGYFLRAESFFNVATYLDELQKVDGQALRGYGNNSLHRQSHGEAFLSLLRHRFSGRGFYLLDEPEAALSPQRQLSFMIMLHETLNRHKEAQFIIATHSPILLAYPGAQIISFDNSQIEEITYKETAAFQITSSFLANPQSFFYHMFNQ